MPQLDRARFAVLAILAVAAGTATAGIAALVRAGAGLCAHRVLASPGMAMPTGPVAGGMMAHGMAIPASAGDGICPILLAVGLVVAALCVFVLVALLASARHLVSALLATFRLLIPGADAPWAARPAPVPTLAGVRLARRRPSRAPPAAA